MKVKKIRLAVFAAVIFTIILSVNSLAATGWVYDNGNWRYYDKNGNQVYSTWIKGNDGLSYYLDPQGNMATNSWIDIYYVDNNGVMLTNQWGKLKPSDRDYVDNYNNQYWYYFSPDGKRVEENWKTINDKKYYFDNYGRMHSGWLDETYFLGDQNDGSMKTGWVKTLSPSDSDEGVKDIDSNKKWYYFSSSGALYIPNFESGCSAATKKIGSETYAFDKEGTMLSGWVNLSSASNSNNIQDYKYFGAANDGSLKSGWQYIKAPSGLSSGINWYYLNAKGVAKVSEANGAYQKSDLSTIDGKSYLFDKYGRTLYGLQWISSEIYYLGTRDQCTIQTGLIKNIDQPNGKTTFYFITSGAKKGQGLTGVNDGNLYYRGKLQKASIDEEYRVVSIAIDGANYNYVVNTSGDIKKNAKVTNEDGEIYKTNSKGILTYIDDEAVNPSDAVGRAPDGPK